MALFLSSLSPPRGSNPRPRPYQGRALPTELGGRSRGSDIKKRLLSATPLRAWTGRLSAQRPPPVNERPEKPALTAPFTLPLPGSHGLFMLAGAPRPMLGTWWRDG